MKIRERPESSYFQGKSCPIRGWSENFHFQEGLGSFRGNISEQDTSIIKQARRILFSNGEPWVKKKVGNEKFDVPMGCFDGAEICELVRICNLYQLKNVIRKGNAGLYRDDGLGMLRNLSGPEVERIRKRIIKIFKDCGLNITIKMNLKTVDFLDVRFDLVNSTYQPYRKPNNEPVYIYKQSNH